MKKINLNMQKVGNKVRLGIYLNPVTAAKFEMYRKTLYGIEISQSAFVEDILKKHFKDIETKKDLPKSLLKRYKFGNYVKIKGK